jgi:hypothetical protein
MNWSDIIFQLKKEKNTDEQIVAYFNNDIVDLEYLKKYNRSRRYYSRVYKNPIHRTSYGCYPWSKMHKVDVYCKQIGREKFLEEYKEKGSFVLGKELGVTHNVVRKYKAMYLSDKPERNYGAWVGNWKSMKRRVMVTEIMKKNDREAPLQKVRKLW